MDEALLIRLYADQPRTADDLPYTQELDQLVVDYNSKRPASWRSLNHREVYLALQRFRKAGKLVRKGRPRLAEVVLRV